MSDLLLREPEDINENLLDDFDSGPGGPDYDGEVEEKKIYPASLDITLRIQEALIGGITTPDLAQAIFDGYGIGDSIRIEYLADALQDLADNAHKEYMRKHKNQRNEN